MSARDTGGAWADECGGRTAGHFKRNPAALPAAALPDVDGSPDHHPNGQFFREENRCF